MPSPIKAYCMKCRTSSGKPTARIIKTYQFKDIIRKNRKYRFAVGKCPKCHGKIWRAYGASDKSKRTKKTTTGRKKVKRRA